MTMRIILQLPDFGRVPLEQMKTEFGPVTGLIYFTHKGRTLAIAEPSRTSR